MIEFDLGLRRVSSRGAVDALLLNTSDVHLLLRALGGGAVGARLYPLARGASDPRCAGYLVVLAHSRDSELPGTVSLRRAGKSLFLPRDAELWPALEDTELDALFVHPVQLLLPGGRFHVFAETDSVNIEDLFALPPALASDWKRAQSGSRIAPSLVSIEAERAVDLTAFFGEEVRDVSARSIQELPPSLEEAQRAGSVRRRAQLGLARFAAWAARFAPKTARAPTWIDRIAKWGRGVLVEDLQQQRADEIRRLMKLLDENPELGLRYALPVNRDGGRGVAPPSSKLGVRNATFDMQELFGSRRSDNWNLANAQRLELEKRYRALASREFRLGRHRKAAYIYAHLLNDLRGAANVLTIGRHFREAAALWRDQLSDPAAAAACLEQGGLNEEALEIWLAHKEWRRAAALLERLGRREEARACWLRVVQLLEQRGSPLDAAEVLLHQLHEIEPALMLLARAWPNSPSAVACRDRWMRVLEEQDRALEVTCWIDAESRKTLEPEESLRLARVLAGSASLPHPEPVSKLAADRLRVIVGAELQRNGAMSRELLQLLPSAAPLDSLLVRDRARFQRALPSAPKSRALALRVTTERAFSIGACIPERCAFASSPEFLFVVRPGPAERPRLECWGWGTGRVEGSWEWSEAPAINARPWITLISRGGELRALVGSFGSDVNWLECSPSRVSRLKVIAGVPPGFPREVLGVGYAPAHGLAVLARGKPDTLSLQRFNSGLRLESWDELEIARGGTPEPRVPLLPFRRGTLLGLAGDRELARTCPGTACARGRGGGQLAAEAHRPWLGTAGLHDARLGGRPSAFRASRSVAVLGGARSCARCAARLGSSRRRGLHDARRGATRRTGVQAHPAHSASIPSAGGTAPGHAQR